jgi:hypothetical protein
MNESVTLGDQYRLPAYEPPVNHSLGVRNSRSKLARTMRFKIHAVMRLACRISLRKNNGTCLENRQTVLLA